MGMLNIIITNVNAATESEKRDLALDEGAPDDPGGKGPQRYYHPVEHSIGLRAPGSRREYAWGLRLFRFGGEKESSGLKPYGYARRESIVRGLAIEAHVEGGVEHGPADRLLQAEVDQQRMVVPVGIKVVGVPDLAHGCQPFKKVVFHCRPGSEDVVFSFLPDEKVNSLEVKKRKSE